MHVHAHCETWKGGPHALGTGCAKVSKGACNCIMLDNTVGYTTHAKWQRSTQCMRAYSEACRQVRLTWCMTQTYDISLDLTGYGLCASHIIWASDANWFNECSMFQLWVPTSITCMHWTHPRCFIRNANLSNSNFVSQFVNAMDETSFDTRLGCHVIL